ncbi:MULTISPECIES: DUF4826 family protein [Pseudoalteromonas]|uniref:DUF4826 domain-containing protein n=1 Tax=Pseudoalteromonas amylolytica TaxID=1859457 RepID=A0A1S1MR07_9GAMM|nr:MULTISPECIES: DUF4826 family protein [Pseudoalteromonas]OHU86970.1 DUF4826 domain-containing protein [Pseudoalteromonas sp. JW3]OHU88321.1 DUF4826 domain-containing protein [Pseudoalteromonas amylolytica]
MSEQQLTPQQIEELEREWQRECFQNAQKHLAEKGIIPSTVFDNESRFLAPLCAIWKMKAQNGKNYWVITGRLPTDHMEASAAKTAREAIKYFSYRWQLKADDILATSKHDETQVKFANLLVNSAHGIYEIADREQLWANEAS